MEERTKEEIDWYFNKFTELIQDMLTEKENLSVHRKDKRVRVQKGRVYWKIFVDQHDEWSGERSSIFGFVRRKDGAIFRARNLKRAPRAPSEATSMMSTQKIILQSMELYMRRVHEKVCRM